MSQSARPTYSQEQLHQYLEYVGMKKQISKESCDTEEGLAYLNLLIALQLAKIPFENLDLHYSTHHSVSLDPDFLFNKIVERKMGRGGYCMQNNAFFGTVLRSLGYKVMPCGARVNSCAQGASDPETSTYTGWEHTVNIMYIDGKKYFVDVGFGAQCPTSAIPVVDGWTGRSTWNKEGDDDMLLKHMHISDNTFSNEEQKLWVYHVKPSNDKPWTPMYCFAEIEFLPQDFQLMNYYVSHSFSSAFTFMIMCTKSILDDDNNVIGYYSLVGTDVRQRRYGKSESLMEIKSEQDRVHALEKFLGIKLDTSEVNGIRGYVSMIR